jgi:circadian clock protein KaiC
VNQLVDMAATFGWDFAAARAGDQLVISHVPVGDLDLDVLASAIRHRLTDGATTRVVIDNLAEMVHAAREAERFPAYLRSLLGVVRAAGASLWVTSQTRTFGPIEEPLAGLMFPFHNVVPVRYIEHRAEVGRAVNVLKMRNSRHDSGMYTCHIADAGLAIGDKIHNATGILGWNVLHDGTSQP